MSENSEEGCSIGCLPLILLIIIIGLCTRIEKLEKKVYKDNYYLEITNGDTTKIYPHQTIKNLLNEN